MPASHVVHARDPRYQEAEPFPELLEKLGVKDLRQALHKQLSETASRFGLQRTGETPSDLHVTSC